MGFPDNLPDVVTVIEPVVQEDSRGEQQLSYAEDSAGITPGVRAWMQQLTTALQSSDRQERKVTHIALLVYPTLSDLARIKWGNLTFRLDGRPKHVERPSGYHHTEAQLILVEG